MSLTLTVPRRNILAALLAVHRDTNTRPILCNLCFQMEG